MNKIYVWLRSVLLDRGLAGTARREGDGPDRSIARYKWAWYGAVLVLLALAGCVHLPIKGDKPICLVDYQTGIQHCEYDTWQACHADLRNHSMCYKR